MAVGLAAGLLTALSSGDSDTAPQPPMARATASPPSPLSEETVALSLPRLMSLSWRCDSSARSFSSRIRLLKRQSGGTAHVSADGAPARRIQLRSGASATSSMAAKRAERWTFHRRDKLATISVTVGLRFEIRPATGDCLVRTMTVREQRRSHAL